MSREVRLLHIPVCQPRWHVSYPLAKSSVTFLWLRVCVHSIPRPLVAEESSAYRKSQCSGVEINRNWPYKWAVPGGASTDSCEYDFRGHSPGDTPEAQGLPSFLKKS